MDQSDRDLLIEIKTLVSEHNKAFDEHKQQDSRQFAIQEKSIFAAHKRIDMTWVYGILALVTFAVSLFVKYGGK